MAETLESRLVRSGLVSRAQLAEALSRASVGDEHLCTAEVGALCLELAGDEQAGGALNAYLDVFTERYLGAKRALPLDEASPAHQALSSYL